jgi:hypothetical protein
MKIFTNSPVSFGSVHSTSCHLFLCSFVIRQLIVAEWKISVVQREVRHVARQQQRLQSVTASCRLQGRRSCRYARQQAGG